MLKLGVSIYILMILSTAEYKNLERLCIRLRPFQHNQAFIMKHYSSGLFFFFFFLGVGGVVYYYYFYSCHARAEDIQL